MKAIETYYNGYRFRSRLEARWAVFFDALNVDYEYEPEGFVLSNGEAYLPDFYLSTLNIYVEIKPSNDLFILKEDDSTIFFSEGHDKYAHFAFDASNNGDGAWFVFGDPQEAIFGNSQEALFHNSKNYLFADCQCIKKVLVKDTENNICECNGKKISKCDYHLLVCGDVLAINSHFAIWNIREGLNSVTTGTFPLPFFSNLHGEKTADELKQEVRSTYKAASKARVARFEHGEHG